MKIEINNNEARLLVHFLDVLSDRLSSSGCNDFDLSEFVPHHGDRMMLIREFHEQNGDPEEFDERMSPTRSKTALADFCVVALLEHRIKTRVQENSIDG